MTNYYVEPSVKKTAFNCARCNVLTTQSWYKVLAQSIDNLPYILTQEYMDNIIAEQKGSVSDDAHVIPEEMLSQWQDELDNTIHIHKNYSVENGFPTMNIHLSNCHHCDAPTLWVDGKIIYPSYELQHSINEDIPKEIQDDIVEADKIYQVSPRGAAALLRLAIQKLCENILADEASRDVNANIEKLVEKGLDADISDSLDIVRVIGNEAVHPGSLDLKDDVDTVNNLFDIINFIADQMITQPRKRKDMFSKLPKGKVEHIKKRNKKATESK